MKLITSVPGVDDLVARINEELPPEIRLWGFVSLSSARSTACLTHVLPHVPVVFDDRSVC
jgi:hypothetical protein